MPRPKRKPAPTAALPPALRSTCPIACSLDLIGDRWTLLVVRDLLMGRRRFSEFLETGEKIPTNILTERLQRLEAAGLVTRSQYQDRPPRFEYQLTPAGTDLGPVLGAIYKWGQSHVVGLGETAGETTVRHRVRQR